MGMEITHRSIGRGIEAVLNGKRFTEGADHRRFDFYSVLYTVLTFGGYQIYAYISVKNKTQQLKECEKAILATVINSIKNNNLVFQATYNLPTAEENTHYCHITEVQAHDHSSMIQFKVDNQFDFQIKLPRGKSFLTLKHDLLKYYIDTERAAKKEQCNNQPINIDLNNFYLLDRMGDFQNIDFNGVKVNNNNAWALILGKANLRGVIPTEDISEEPPNKRNLPLLPDQTNQTNQTNHFHNVKLDATLLTYFISRNMNLNGADLSHLNGKNEDGTDNPDKSLAGIDVQGAQLEGANFSSSDCKNMKCQRAILKGANFEATDLTQVNFTKADLTYVIVNKATKRKEVLLWEATNADHLYKSDEAIDAKLSDEMFIQLKSNQNRKKFTGLTLSSTNPQKNDLTKQDLTDVALDKSTLKSTDFSDANLTGTNFKSAKLDGMVLNNKTILNQTNFQQADLTGARLNEKILKQPDTTHQEVDLTGTKLVGAYLNKSWVEQATLDGVRDFTGATFCGDDWTNINLSGCILKNVIFENKKASLKGSTFDENNLPDLIKSREETKKTKNAQDQEVIERTSLDLQGIICRGNGIQNKRVHSNEAHKLDLHLANLQNANFSYCDLSYAILEDADCSYANMSGSTLDHANLTNADFSYIRIDLSTFVGATTTGVIVTDQDRQNREQQHLSDLALICKSAPENQDITTLGLKTHAQHTRLKNGVFFPATQRTLHFGDSGTEGGPQSMYVYKNTELVLDDRHIRRNNCEDKQGAKTHVNERLLNISSTETPDDTQGTSSAQTTATPIITSKWNDDQKRLFHWLRAALYLPEDLLTVRIHINQANEAMSKNFASQKALTQIYNVRASIPYRTSIFDMIYKEYEKQHPQKQLNNKQKDAVKTLFIDPRYIW